MATDQLCEHHVRKIKDLFKSFHSQLEPSLVEKAVLSYNPISVIKDFFLDCLGMFFFIKFGSIGIDMTLAQLII